MLKTETASPSSLLTHCACSLHHGAPAFSPSVLQPCLESQEISTLHSPRFPPHPEAPGGLHPPPKLAPWWGWTGLGKGQPGPRNSPSYLVATPNAEAISDTTSVLCTNGKSRGFSSSSRLPSCSLSNVSPVPLAQYNFNHPYPLGSCVLLLP